MRFEVDIERHYFEECSLKGFEIRIPTNGHILPLNISLYRLQIQKIEIIKAKITTTIVTR